MNLQVKKNVLAVKNNYQHSCVLYMMQEERMFNISFDGMGTKKI